MSKSSIDKVIYKLVIQKDYSSAQEFFSYTSIDELPSRHTLGTDEIQSCEHCTNGYFNVEG